MLQRALKPALPHCEYELHVTSTKLSGNLPISYAMIDQFKLNSVDTEATVAFGKKTTNVAVFSLCHHFLMHGNYFSEI